VTIKAVRPLAFVVGAPLAALASGALAHAMTAAGRTRSGSVRASLGQRAELAQAVSRPRSGSGPNSLRQRGLAQAASGPRSGSVPAPGRGRRPHGTDVAGGPPRDNWGGCRRAAAGPRRSPGPLVAVGIPVHWWLDLRRVAAWETGWQVSGPLDRRRFAARAAGYAARAAGYPVQGPLGRHRRAESAGVPRAIPSANCK
jgi:hypothetical protein